jgi:hypothetical protein
MAKSPREAQKHGFDRKTLMPSKSYFFLNGELVKLLHKSKAHNIAYLWNYKQKREQIVQWTDFVKHRERAFSISAAAWVLGYAKQSLKKAEWEGDIFSPTYTRYDAKGKVSQVSRGYYSESQLYELRELFAFRHRGRPRKDGRVNSVAISEQELRFRLGDGMLLYAEGPDGKMIPVWKAYE